MRISISTLAAAVATLGLSVLAAAPVAAQSSGQTLGYVVAHGADGPGCADGPFHPNVTATAVGGKMQLWGCGSFETASKSADGGGGYLQTDATGNVSGGSWIALKLLRFQSYGGSEEFEGLVFQGGVASFLVHLSPSSGGAGSDAVLEVHCTDPGDPPPGVHEGFRLAVQGGPNYNQELSGETGFFTG
jgi:hypothetical protein